MLQILNTFVKQIYKPWMAISQNDKIWCSIQTPLCKIWKPKKTRKIFLFQQDVKQVQVHFPGYLFNSWILMLENMSLVWVSQCHSRCTPTSTKSYFLVCIAYYTVVNSTLCVTTSIQCVLDCKYIIVAYIVHVNSLKCGVSRHLFKLNMESDW